MKTVKNVSTYVSAYDLILENERDFLAGLSEDEECFVCHFDDFEGFQYILVDYETVIVTDSCSGLVLNVYDSIDMFFCDIEELMKEEV